MVSLPVIVFGDHTKALKFINFNFAPGADGIKILKPKQSVEPKFAFYLLHIIRNQIPDKGYARHFQYLRQEKYFVPPLPEQQRIVAKIEELFSELDKAVENLQTARQQLKIYRQSVLKHAFEGKLTAAWRKSLKFKARLNDEVGQVQSLKLAAEPELVYQTKNGLPEGWKWKTVGDTAKTCLGKMLDKNKNKGEYQPYLRNINVRWGSFDLTDVLTMKFEPHENERFSIKKGDLIICEGGEPGRSAIWKSDKDFKIQKALHRVRFNANIDTSFFYYYLSFSASSKKLDKYFTGTTIKHFTGASLNKFIFPVCPIDEQNQIVAEIEKRFSEADKLEESIETALRQTKALRQSILKKAFEGKLVGQDENKAGE
jgi:type I restriction enzyme S subunit